MIQTSLIISKYPNLVLSDKQISVLRTISVCGEVWLAAKENLTANKNVFETRIKARPLLCRFGKNGNDFKFEFEIKNIEKDFRLCDFDYFLDLPTQIKNEIFFFWHAEFYDT